MNKRNVVGILALFSLYGCGEGQGVVEPEMVAEPASGPPNIVLLFADDMGYGDLGSYGHPYNRTPNIDQLAAEGQRWTDFYVAASVCTPSRGALLTGRIPVRTGIYGDQIPVYFPNDPGGLPAREVTMAEALQDVGYRTGIFGKWHLGDAKAAWPTRHGFDEWLGLPYSNDMDWVGGRTVEEAMIKYADPKLEYWAVPLLRSSVTADGYSDETLEQPAQQTTLTKRYTEAVIDFMRRSGDQPFFAYLPYTMPHTPLFRSAGFVHRSLGGRYGDVIEEIDWSVGEIKQALFDLGIADNTLVIFTSDNGPWLAMKTEGGRAGLLRHGKGTTFEGGMRVPAVFWWPGRVQQGVVSEIGSTLDLFATVAALAGADASSAVDGVDLAPVLFAGEASPRNEISYYRGSELYAYRVGPWKAHFVTEGRYAQPPERQEHDVPLLYNLMIDPSERFDVAADNADALAMVMAAVQRHKAGVVIAPPELDKKLAVGAG